jgi:hypothetical protein
MHEVSFYHQFRIEFSPTATVEIGRKINVVSAIVCMELLSVRMVFESFLATRLKLFQQSAQCCLKTRDDPHQIDHVLHSLLHAHGSQIYRLEETLLVPQSRRCLTPFRGNLNTLLVLKIHHVLDCMKDGIGSLLQVNQIFGDVVERNEFQIVITGVRRSDRVLRRLGDSAPSCLSGGPTHLFNIPYRCVQRPQLLVQLQVKIGQHHGPETEGIFDRRLPALEW